MNELDILAMVVKGLVAEPEFPQEIKAKYEANLKQFESILDSAKTEEEKAALALAVIILYPKLQKLAETLETAKFKH